MSWVARCAKQLRIARGFDPHVCVRKLPMSHGHADQDKVMRNEMEDCGLSEECCSDSCQLNEVAQSQSLQLKINKNIQAVRHDASNQVISYNIQRIEINNQHEGVWRNGSASDSRSEGWEFESLCPHFFAHVIVQQLYVYNDTAHDRHTNVAQLIIRKNHA